MTSSIRPVIFIRGCPAISRPVFIPPSPAKYISVPYSLQYSSTYFSGFLYMPRSIEGANGGFTTRYPDSSGFTASPISSRTSQCTPGSAGPATPGTNGPIPGSEDRIIPPVSVCQYVSTNAQRRSPIFSKNHFHVSGSIGSPTEAKSLNEEKSCPSTHLSPAARNALIAVGAV